MLYTSYELLWLFLIYSFCGWLAETTVAAVKQKRFVNRGLVNLPFCILYGFAAVFITVFGSELTGLWLYVGSLVIIIVFVNLAGSLIEKVYHEKWWDYTVKRWNIGRYISVPVAGFFSIISLIMMKWGNPFLISCLHKIPELFGEILVWTLIILLGLDAIATWFVVHGKSGRKASWEKVDQEFDKVTGRLSSSIYRGCRRIEKRIQQRVNNAYPHSETEEVKADKNCFAYGCCFYKLVWLFIIGAFAGDIVETIFCRVTAGVWMSRSSVVWGPFSIVWGLAIAFATILLHKYQHKADSTIFAAGVFLGGVYEYVCSVFTEIVFGKVFWDYSKIPFNLGGRINLLYCFFWGIAAVVWIKYMYPYLSAWIEKVPIKAGKIISWVLIVFMCVNMMVSGLALTRSTQRANGIPAKQVWQQIMDERFDDERLARIYPNAIDTD